MDAQQWDERYSQRDSVWSGRVNPTLVEFAQGLRPGTAVDLACGEGGDAIWLAQQGWTVTAVDFSAAGVHRARRHAEDAGVAGRIDWVVADVASWRPDTGFDLVAMHFLHTPDIGVRDAAIRTAWASTGPGGTCLVVSHHPENATRGTAGGPPDPAVLYGVDEALAALGSSPGDPRLRVAETRDRRVSAGLWVDSVIVLQREGGAG